jgi:predicted RNA-binding protein with PUA-like domain
MGKSLLKAHPPRWLIKQEPGAYAWADLVRDRTTAWTGIRNLQARNHLRAMRRGERLFFYHSGAERQIVGIARVARPAYADPTARDGDWSAVDIAACEPLPNPVTLAAIKADPLLRQMVFTRQSRLSVAPVTDAEGARLLQLSVG